MQRRERKDEEKAVSEILGVIMMLAKVVSIMGGVFVFLNPYLVAFHDNTNWNSANNIADRIEDRLDVVGDAPNGTGTRQALSLQASSCLLYTSDAADDSLRVDLGGRRIIKKSVEMLVMSI